MDEKFSTVKVMKDSASYFKYWGKAEKAEEGKPPCYHLLPYHCLDVAAVG